MNEWIKKLNDVRPLSCFPAKMTLVYARAILSIEEISSHNLKLYVDATDNFTQKWVLIDQPEYMTQTMYTLF